MKRGIIGLVLVLTVCLTILLISDNLNKEETPVKKPKKEKIETEEKIIDKDEKQELDKTISLLTSSDYCQFKIQKKYNNGCNFSQKEISSTDLEFKYKLYSLIMNFDTKEKIEEEININDKVYSVDSKINEEEIKNAYQKLYGTLDSYDPNAVNEIEDDYQKIIYKDNYFYIETEKEEKIENEVVTYNYKYTKKDNKFYVYVSTAFVNMIKNGDNQTTNYEIYSDYNMTNLKEEGLYSEYRKEIKDENDEVTIVNNFKVNKDNYKNYNHYKYTFIKNENNNYIFEKLEKI